jgi:hypothetical protein
MTPFRFADTRRNLRVTPLLAGVPKRIKIGGIAGISASATALSANFTVVGSAGTGALTVYNCSTWPPTTPNFTFTRNQVVGNATVAPLSAADSAIGAGYLCLYSPTATQVVIDVTGYFTASQKGQHYTAVTPTTLARTGIAAGATRQLSTAALHLPADATAIAINVTTGRGAGLVTAYGCGAPRPLVLTVNPRADSARQNFAIVPLLPNKGLCLFSLNNLAIRVDAVGYFSTGAGTHLSPAVVTRITDTADTLQPMMNLGASASTIPAGATRTLQLAGQRGLPADVTAVELSVTASQQSAAGTLTVWGGDCSVQPAVATVTFPANANVTNTAQVDLGTTGTLCVRSTASTRVTIDVHGWWN